MPTPASWPGEFPVPTRQYESPSYAGDRPFRSLLGIGQLSARQARSADPAAISQRFSIGALSLIVAPGQGSAEQLAQTIRRRMRRGRIGYDLQPLSVPRISPFYTYSYRPAYTFGPAAAADVAGYPGVARTIDIRRRYRRRAQYRVVQRYAVTGPYGLVLTAPAEQADLAGRLGTVGLSPAGPPVITPVVRLPGVGCQQVHEMVVLDAGSIRLTAMAVAGPVAASAGEFAQATLAGLRSLSPDLAAEHWQPDVFLGGQPCLRTTLLRGGGNTLVRSEFCWVGVVGGRGVQILVAGTKSIIRLENALPLRDSVMLLPPD